MQGWLLPGDLDTQTGINQSDAIEMSKEVFHLMAPTELIVYPGGDLKVLLIGAVTRDNIASSLPTRGATVVRVPWFDDLARHTSEVDGSLISNGPGNPKDLGDLIDQLKQIMASFNEPILRICLGHQILALAAGGDTYKSPYGHSSVNQPTYTHC